MFLFAWANMSHSVHRVPIGFHRFKTKFRFNRTFHLHATPRTATWNGGTNFDVTALTDFVQLGCISSAKRNSLRSWNLFRDECKFEESVVELLKLMVVTHHSMASKTGVGL
jgi:hypothetical protein